MTYTPEQEEPRVVRLDDLTGPQRRLVLALIEAARSMPAPEPAADRLLTIDQARERLGGISRSTLYQLIGRNELRTLSVGTRRFVPESAVAEFIERSA